MTKLILAMTIAFSAYAQGDPAPRPAAEKFQEAALPVGKGAWVAVVGPEAYLALIAEDLNEALRLRELGLPGHCNLFRRAAAALARVEAHAEAIRVLNLVVEDPESGFDLAAAHRMQGQYWLVLGQSRQAERAFEEQLALYDADPSMQRRFTSSYLSGISQLRMLLLARGDVHGALSVNARIVRDRGLFDRATVASALRAAADIHGRLGDKTSQIEFVDELLGEYAQDVVGGNAAVARLRLMRAELIDATRSTDAYIAELRRLWDDPDLVSDPWTVEVVAQRLGQALKARGRVDEWLGVTGEALDRLDTIRKHPAPAVERESGSFDRRMRSSEVTLLSVLKGAAQFGRPDLALYSLERLSELLPDERERENIRKQRERLEDRLIEKLGAVGADPTTNLVRFLNAWVAGEGDYNNDGVTDSADLLLYLECWTSKR